MNASLIAKLNLIAKKYDMFSSDTNEMKKQIQNKL